MSDAVMVPSLRDAAQAVVDRWETPLWKDVEPTAHVIARLRQALAASTPVECPSNLQKVQSATPPSVSIDNGSRPQESVPTEGPDGSVLADLEKAWEILAAIPAINDLGSQYQEDIQAAILTALRATPQPADGCSSNEGADQ